MGGQADRVAEVIKESYSSSMSLTEAMALAMRALASSSEGGQPDSVTADQLEVALLERTRPHRTFRRLSGTRLESLLEQVKPAQTRAVEAGASSANGSANGADPATDGQEPPAGADGGDS